MITDSASRLADLIEQLAESHYVEAGCTGCDLYRRATDAVKDLRQDAS